jgi:DNA mismatch repair ATPase MutL
VSCLADYLVEGSDSEFRRTDVNPHINLQLSNKEVRILLCFQKDFEKLGLKFEVMDDTSIQVTSVPTCLLAREQREVGYVYIIFTNK